jgi:hypothetical protein
LGGLDAKVGTPFADGQFLRFSLPVTRIFNHPSFIFFAVLLSCRLPIRTLFLEQARINLGALFPITTDSTIVDTVANRQ